MTVLVGCCIAFIVLYLITGQKNIIDIINIALKSKGIKLENENINEKVNEKIKDKPQYNKKEKKMKKIIIKIKPKKESQNLVKNTKEKVKI